MFARWWHADSRVAVHRPCVLRIPILYRSPAGLVRATRRIGGGRVLARPLARTFCSSERRGLDGAEEAFIVLGHKLALCIAGTGTSSWSRDWAGRAGGIASGQVRVVALDLLNTSVAQATRT